MRPPASSPAGAQRPDGAASGGFPGAGQAAREQAAKHQLRSPASRPGRAGPLRAARAGAEADAAARRRLAARPRRRAEAADRARRWQVSLSTTPASLRLLDQEKMAEERVRADVLADPNVRAVMDAFPDADSNPLLPRKAPDMPDLDLEQDHGNGAERAGRAAEGAGQSRQVSRSRASPAAAWSRSARPPRARSSASTSTRACFSRPRRRWSRI